MVDDDTPGGPRPPLFLKQYGAKRTGTNYLRSLIRFNYPGAEVVPLMHILGDKHSPPPPFDELWCRAQRDADPAFSFVMGATRYAPPFDPTIRCSEARCAGSPRRSRGSSSRGRWGSSSRSRIPTRGW